MYVPIAERASLIGGIAANAEEVASQFAERAMRDLVVSIAEIGAAHASNLSESRAYGVKRCVLELVDGWPKEIGVSDIDREELAGLYSASLSKSAADYRGSGVLIVAMGVCASEHASESLSWLADNIGVIYDKAGHPSRILREILTDGLPLESRVIAAAESSVNGEQTAIHVPMDTCEPFIRGEIAELFGTVYYGKRCGRNGPKRLASSIGAVLGEDIPRGIGEFSGKTLIKLIESEQCADNYGFRRAALALALQVFRKQGTPNVALEDGLAVEFVARKGFFEEWQEGFRAVFKDPACPAPDWDKWVLFPNGTEGRTMASKGYVGTALDFSCFDPPMARLMKAFVWAKKGSASTLYSDLTTARRFFSTGGPFLVKTSGKTTVPVITRINVIRAIGACESSNLRASVEAFVIQLGQLQDKGGPVDIEPGALLLARDRSRREPGEELDAISTADLKMLIRKLEELSGEGILFALSYYAACLIVLTPLRPEEILDLKISDLTDERNGRAYSVRRIAKGKRGGKRKVLLTRTARTVIDAVIAVTSQTREEAAVDVGDYIFLYRGQKGVHRTLSTVMLRDKLRHAAESAGIDGPVNPASMRKRHMTQVVEEGVKRNLSRLDLRPLTNHIDPRVVGRFYIRPDIRKYLEATNGVIIGENPAKGSIADDEPALGRESLVEGGCGYCRNESCQIEGVASCLMCSGFVTTPRHIPEFKEAVEIISRRIAAANTLHDKQHLAAVKRLFLYYLGALMTMAASSGEEDRDDLFGGSY